MYFTDPNSPHGECEYIFRAKLLSDTNRSIAGMSIGSHV